MTMLTTADAAGAELRQWRQLHDLTLAELADYLGVHWITVQRWEAGRIGVPPYLYLALREVERLHLSRHPDLQSARTEFSQP